MASSFPRDVSRPSRTRAPLPRADPRTRSVPMRAVFFVAAALLALPPAASLAQDRIAYANVELILSLMPETKAAAASVDSLGRDLAKDLERKEAAAQKKVEEARSAQSKGASEAELDKFRKELSALESQMRKDAE